MAPVGAQTLGGFEPFTQQKNGGSWAFFNYATDQAFDAPWNFSNSGDPEIYATFTGGAGVSLFADVMSSNGIFVGNYADAGIDTILCDIFIEDINTFSEVEFFILAGDTFYYSNPYVIGQSGWTGLTNSLSRDQWYIYDEADQQFLEVPLTPAILFDVTEIGLNFYPSSTAADGQIVAVDNFSLLPELSSPKITISTKNSTAKLSFTGIEGIQYTVQTASNLDESSWTNVGNPFEIVGESERTVPMVNKGFFRILSQPFYIEAP
jgi:hypothetical protein